jgi:anti-sigma-K factor RskA
VSERDHAVIEELLSVDALGGLDDADRGLLDRERSAHGACEECARLESEFNEVAGRLGLSLEPVAIRAGMADDILQAPVAGERADGAPTPARGGPQHRSGAWRGLVAVAAAFVFVCGWVVRSATDDSGAELAQSRFVEFTGEGAEGTLAMAYEPGQPGVVLFGSDLPDPGDGRVYEVWMIAGDDAPVSGGCLRPTDGRILTFVDADLGNTDIMAVTVESDACPSAPTTDPVLTASLA